MESERNVPMYKGFSALYRGRHAAYTDQPIERHWSEGVTPHILDGVEVLWYLSKISVFGCDDPWSHFRDMETGWVIVISVSSCFALVVCVTLCIINGNQNLHNARMYEQNRKSRLRVKYRQDKKEAVERARKQEMLQGKTEQEGAIIWQQYQRDKHNKNVQYIIDKDRNDKQYNEIWRNATEEEKSAITKKDNDASAEERRKEVIADRELDEEIANLQKIEKEAKEAAKRVDNNMFISNSGQYGTPVQYSLVPSQSPVTVQVWSQ